MVWHRSPLKFCQSPPSLAVAARRLQLQLSCCLVLIAVMLSAQLASACPTSCACFTGSDGRIASCRHQNLDRVPDGLPSDIIELDMGHCQLRKLDKSTFPPLPRLRRLSVDWCRVESIDAWTFAELPGLEFLILSHNAIDWLDPEAFRGLAGLRSLQLDSNNIRTLPVGLFTGLRLDELQLHNNSLQALDDGAFEGSSIVSLNLDENNISNISIDLFTPLKRSLKNFNLSHNEQPLRFETEDVFSGFNFSDLRISYDGLRDSSFLRHVKAHSLDISGHHFSQLNFTDCKNFASLEEFYLRNLNIEILNETILSNLVSVTLLDLSDNLLYTLDGQVFRYTPRLRVLRLDGNLFISLPEDLGVRLDRLEVLKVPTNKLAMLRPDAFVGMSSLVELDVRNNQIQVIDEAMRRTFNKLQTIRLGGNPLHCNCEMRWYRIWLTERPTKNTGAYTCTTPFNGSMYAMKPEDFVCKSPSVWFVTGSTNVMEGDSVYLTCTAKGDPAPEVEWSSPFGEVVSVTPPFNRTRYMTYAIWHVSIIQPYQAGWYTCTASNLEGTSRRMTYIHVYPPGGSTIDVAALVPPTTPTTTITTTTTTTTTPTTTTTAPTTTTTTTPSTTSVTMTTTAVTTTSLVTETTPSTSSQSTTTTTSLPDTTPARYGADEKLDERRRGSDLPTWAIIVVVVSIVVVIVLIAVVIACVSKAVKRKYKRKYNVSSDAGVIQDQNCNVNGCIN